MYERLFVIGRMRTPFPFDKVAYVGHSIDENPPRGHAGNNPLDNPWDIVDMCEDIRRRNHCGLPNEPATFSFADSRGPYAFTVRIPARWLLPQGSTQESIAYHAHPDSWNLESRHRRCWQYPSPVSRVRSGNA